MALRRPRDARRECRPGRRADGAESRGRRGRARRARCSRASACEVIRPPNDLPPANSGEAGCEPLCLDDRSPHRRLGDLRRVGTAAPLLHVRELVAERGDAALGEQRRTSSPGTDASCRRRRRGRGRRAARAPFGTSRRPETRRSSSTSKAIFFGSASRLRHRPSSSSRSPLGLDGGDRVASRASQRPRSMSAQRFESERVVGADGRLAADRALPRRAERHDLAAATGRRLLARGHGLSPGSAS